MLTSISGDRKMVACDAQKSDQPFFCPECSGETILRKGTMKVSHFSHKSHAACEYGKGESETHRRCKQSIYDFLLKNKDVVANPEMEKDLGSVRPDIYFEKDGEKIAIEVQISSLNLDKIIHRTQEYDRLGVSVLWMSVWTPALAKALHSVDTYFAPRVWEKWLHATYYGRVYYWLNTLIVIPVHFECVMLEKEGWDEREIPGYSYPSKRYRWANRGRSVNILQNFNTVKRTPWQGGQIYVPRCQLYMDDQAVWWKSENSK